MYFCMLFLEAVGSKKEKKSVLVGWMFDCDSSIGIF